MLFTDSDANFQQRGNKVTYSGIQKATVKIRESEFKKLKFGILVSFLIRFSEAMPIYTGHQ